VFTAARLKLFYAERIYTRMISPGYFILNFSWNNSISHYLRGTNNLFSYLILRPRHWLGAYLLITPHPYYFSSLVTNPRALICYLFCFSLGLTTDQDLQFHARRWRAILEAILEQSYKIVIYISLKICIQYSYEFLWLQNLLKQSL
jgi:hypothetical protein